MTKDQIFSILGIEATSDTNLIKKAYREKLVNANPEDHPEEFKQLREAYESALSGRWQEDTLKLVNANPEDHPEEFKQLRETNESALSGQRQEDTLIQNKPLSLADEWEARLNHIYTHLSLRQDEASWKALFHEDIAVALDTSEEIQTRLFKFLMDHTELPDHIWRCIGEEYQVLSIEEQLKEQFPENFINYICWKMQNDGFINFTFFSGPDDADYDQYIRDYLALKEAIDSDKWDSLTALMTPLEASKIWHPYFDVEKMRIAVHSREDNTVQLLLGKLLPYKDGSNYLTIKCGLAAEYLEKWVLALELDESLLAKDSQNYAGLTGKVRYLLHEKKWSEAKELNFIIMDITINDELNDYMEVANKALIEEYKQTCAKNPDDKSTLLELAWCYFQNKLFEDAKKILIPYQPASDKELDYNNLFGRVYFANDDYSNALPYLLRWQELLEKLIGSEDAEAKKKLERLGYCYYSIGHSYNMLGDTDSSDLTKASNYLTLATEHENSAQMLFYYQMEKVNIDLKLHDNESALQLSNQILEYAPDCVPALCNRQKANYYLRNAQEVVDDYHAIVRLEPNTPSAYIFAAKVFLAYNQYQDVKNVYEHGKEENIESDELTFIALQAKRYSIDTDAESYSPLLKEYDALIEKIVFHKKTDIKKPYLLYQEKVFCLMDLLDYKKAMEEINYALLLYPENKELTNTKAGILRQSGHPDDALFLYNELLSKDPDNVSLLMNAASCYEKLYDDTNAASLCEKALCIDSDQRRANNMLMNIYQRKMNKDKDISYFKKAMEHADRQLEIDDTAYYRIERGLLFLDAGKYPEGLEDFIMANELDDNNLYVYNNEGVTYGYMDKPEKALEAFSKALECMKSREKKIVLPVENIINCYLTMGRYLQAEEILKEYSNLFSSQGILDILADIHIRKGEEKLAISCRREIIEKRDDGQTVKQWMANPKREFIPEYMDYLHATGDSYEKANVMFTYKAYDALYMEYPDEYRIVSNYLMFLREQCVSGFYPLTGSDKKGYAISKKWMKKHGNEEISFNQFKMASYLIFFAYQRNKSQDIQETYQKYLPYAESLLSKDTTYLDMYTSRPLELFVLGRFFLYAGYDNRAEEIFSSMSNCPRCQHCNYSKCWEAMQGMALVYIYRNDTQKAIYFFQRSLEIASHENVAYYYLKKKGLLK